MAGVAPEVPRALAGRYRLVRLLARGGMAEVWEGRDEVLSRPVAVKVLLAHLASDPFLRERFRREAITAARLVHPGIVAIFDAGVEVLGEDGTTAGSLLSGHWARDERQRLEMAWPDEPSTAFIVMELVPGETLRDLISRSGPMAPDLAVAIAAQVTEALAYAHAQGLVHRDIKPANVLLGTEGADLVRVKVADFGIAKAAATAHLDLTASGTLLGTPKYLSPEQVHGLEPDARADLYSLGVVLYEMLCGRAPFKESTDMATALAHVQQQVPPLQELRPGLPPALYALVSSLLMKEPARRAPSALVVGGALASVRKTLGMPSPEPYVNVKAAPAGTRLKAGQPTARQRRATAAQAGATVAATPKTGPKGAGRSPKSGSGRAQVANGAVTQAPTSTLAVGDATEVAVPSTKVTRAGKAAPSTAAVAPRQARRAARRHRTGRAVSVFVSALLVTGLAVLGDLVLTGRRVGSDGAPTSSTGPAQQGGGTPIAISHVSELAQHGNTPDDNLSTLDDVITGKSPAWTSQRYFGPYFGNYGGFGLVVQLSGAHALASLEVRTQMTDWQAQTYVSDTDHPAVGQWGHPTSSATGLSGDHTFSLDGRRGSWVLFWMINPGPDDQAMVSKLTVT